MSPLSLHTHRHPRGCRCRHSRRHCRRLPRSRLVVPLCRCALVRSFGASAFAPARHDGRSSSFLCPRFPGWISACEHSPNSAHYSGSLLSLTLSVVSISRSVLWQIRFICPEVWVIKLQILLNTSYHAFSPKAPPLSVNTCPRSYIIDSSNKRINIIKSLISYNIHRYILEKPYINTDINSCNKHRINT